MIIYKDSVICEKVYEGLNPVQLIEQAIKRGEGELTDTGALSIKTGCYTGRSPKDRYIVKDEITDDTINWGSVNRPITEAIYDDLLWSIKNYLKDKEVFAVNGRVGAAADYSYNVRCICEYASQALFCSQLFIKGIDIANRDGFTVISAPGFKADKDKYNLNSEAFIILNLKDKTIIIGGTQYSGEIKKAIFTAMNFFLPQRGVLPMHCSANEGKDGDVAILFGLSGTGKTTLSADPNRALIGDDEHGWSDDGIFNFEGGCYAKAINLSRDREKDIYDAIRLGSVLENVVLDNENIPQYDDDSLTENTRAAYPLNYINNIKDDGRGGIPRVILFLTADAFGVIPPISKLTKEQAMYYFLSGYTSKVAGTERGLKEPEATFSTCFGEPFMPLHPKKYAKLLGEKIDKYGVRVYMVNTGWIEGPYGTGRRIPLKYTRAMVSAAVDGTLEEMGWRLHEGLDLLVPKSCPMVPEELLIPENTWKNKEDYFASMNSLKEKFQKNYKRYL
ncbi:phosphoenolpyruvate carboxykinase (ATP) [Alloiococcus sp. CFN-8]|uniref:phosphoenolpyruvate carboxykinase (ATP) n=1 Tax=Alloiococcus sp. CFN-8 TaxID=3416081 RepID=UPI003CFAF527